MGALTPPKLAGALDESRPSPARVNRAENPPTRIPSAHPSTTPPRKDLRASRGVKARPVIQGAVDEQLIVGTQVMVKKVPQPPPMLKEQQPRMSNIRRQRKGGEPEEARAASPPRPIVSPTAAPADLMSAGDSSVGIDFHRPSWHSDNSWGSDQGGALREYLEQETRKALSPQRAERAVPPRPRFGVFQAQPLYHPGVAADTSVHSAVQTEVQGDPVEGPVESPAGRAELQPSRPAAPLAALDIWRGGKPPRARRPSETGDLRSDTKTQRFLQALPPSERECVAFILALKPLVAPRASLLDYLTRVDSSKVKALLPLKAVFDSAMPVQPPRVVSPRLVSPPKMSPPRLVVETQWDVPAEFAQAVKAAASDIPDWGIACDVFGMLTTLKRLAEYVTRMELATTRVNKDCAFLRADRSCRRKLFRGAVSRFHLRLPFWTARTLAERADHLAVRRLLCVSETDTHRLTHRAAVISLASLKDAVDRPEYHSEPSPEITETLAELLTLQHKAVVLRQQAEHLQTLLADGVQTETMTRLVSKIAPLQLDTRPARAIPNPLEDMYERLFTDKYVSRLERTRQRWNEHDKEIAETIEGRLRNAKRLGASGTIDVTQFLPVHAVQCLEHSRPNTFVGTVKVGNGTDLRQLLRANEDPPSTPASGRSASRRPLSRRGSTDLDFASVKRLMALPFTPLAVHDDFLGRRKRNSLTISSAPERDTPLPSRNLAVS